MLQYMKTSNQKEVYHVSEQTESIFLVGAIFVLMIPLLSFIEPSGTSLKENIKETIKGMLVASVIILIAGFFSYIDVLHDIVDFTKSKTFLIPLMILTIGIPTLWGLINMIKNINSKNYKMKIVSFLGIMAITILFNVMGYIVITQGKAPIVSYM